MLGCRRAYIMTSRPKVSIQEMVTDMQRIFGLKAQNVSELLSYDDTMFLFTADTRYIAKYYNPSITAAEVLGAITDVLQHLTQKQFTVPRPVMPTNNHNPVVTVVPDVDNEGCKVSCYLVVFHYIEGELLATSHQEPHLWRSLGKLVGDISMSMSEMKSCDYRRDFFPWDSMCGDTTLQEIRHALPADKLPGIQIDAVIDSIKKMKRALSDLPMQFIHGDINEYNIVLGAKGSLGIIDFNDLTRGYRVLEISHLLAYIGVCQNSNPSVLREIYLGFASVVALSSAEIHLIYDIMFARMTVSVTMGCRTILDGDDNAYVRKCVEDNARFLRGLLAKGKESFNRDILGL